MVDPIADMLTRIRNSQAVGHKTVSVPFSKLKYELANLVCEKGFFASVSSKGKQIKKEIEIVLKYEDQRKTKPFIQGLKRISKQGQRIYLSHKELNKFLKERGITIISTSQGLVVADEAKKKGIGGEVLCRIW